MIAQGIGSRLPTHCAACNSPRTWGIHIPNSNDGVYACPFHLGDAVERTGQERVLLVLSPDASSAG